MAKTRSLAAQFQYAVMKSQAYGQSKYDERGKGRASMARYKTYSYDTMDARLDAAKDLGKYLQDHFPEMKYARDITFDSVQQWLNNKADSGCSKATLEGYTANARTLFRLCDNAYPTFQHVNDKTLREQLHVPEPVPELVRESHRDAAGMARVDFEKLKNSFSKTSNGYKACVIQEATGARADGCVSLRGSDIQIDKNGKCIVHLCEKGGRHRYVDVVRPEYVQALSGLKERAGDSYILNHRGDPIKAKSLSDQYRTHMKKLELTKDYTGTNSHAIRKMWANERYKEYRASHTKYDTVRYLNEQLGHGADRDEGLLGHYVDDIS